MFKMKITKNLNNLKNEGEEKYTIISFILFEKKNTIILFTLLINIFIFSFFFAIK